MNLRPLPPLRVAQDVIGGSSGGASVAVTDEEVVNLTRRTAEANSALVRGDFDGYFALIEPAEDYTLMAPFGGALTWGFDSSNENWAAIARFFRFGTFDQEVVATYGSGDLVVLVTIERVGAAVCWLNVQNLKKRATQVFRREE